MFCPNCGKECDTARFCVKCGTELSPEVKETEAWSVGMPCPHCGGTQLNGRNCAFCGAQLMLDRSHEKNIPALDQGLDSYEIPYRKFYPNPLSKYCLSIEKNGIVIEIPSLFVKNKIRIAYDQLIDVHFRLLTEKDVQITFRWNAPSEGSQTVGNVCETVFKAQREEYGDDTYYHVFHIIKHLAPSNARFQVAFPPLRETEAIRLEPRVNLEDYFDAFNPLRTQAVDALCSDARISREIAQALIDELFNRRQKELYDADSRLTVRDYNRLMQYKRQKYEEWEKERYQKQNT